MVFSSNAFLFFFLPAVLIIYFIARKNRTAANAVLSVMSLLFYAWGEPKFVLVMLLSILINWLIALMIQKHKSKPRAAKAYLAIGIAINVLILGVFKYASFAIRNINRLFNIDIVDPKIALPIGISFFTFQAMSYIIDVYRGKGEAQKHFMGVCLFISFFPQLIAGPIVRYETVADQLINRKETMEDFTEGVRRFMVGFCKKAILANTIARMVDYIYALEMGKTSVVMIWLGTAGYIIQVYYDFSGYSDMAIGLGRVFGFHFLENFNLPFISKSVTEFWRRWHISMGTWFREYIFIPMGGSRVKSVWRLLFNMFVVWALTGLWHGAEWTYVCWGVGFFVVLAIEKLTGLGKWMEKHAVGHFYAMFMVVAVSVFIRSADISSAFKFYKTMFGFGGAPFFNRLTWFIIKEYFWYLLFGVLCSLPIGNKLKQLLHIPDGAWEIASGVVLIALMLVAVSNTVAGGYNPFIYYNF